MISHNFLQLHTLNKRLKALLELLNTHLLTLPIHHLASRILRREQYIAHNLNDAITRHAIVNRNARKAIDPDLHKRAIPCHIDGKRLALEHSRQVVVVVRRPGSNVLIIASGVEKGVRV
jgi:hypothetical protein